ncbi:MAG: sugar phosphate isomerase/epimerase [Lachnospiraceae bacterium]|nr:sugar phosphate isomerase/epimerase [Lachnospiraceae bacterium]
MSKLYCIPTLKEIKEFAGFSERFNAGFEYNEFFLPHILEDETETGRIMKQYMGLERDRSKDTLHGVFLDICVNSTDPLIFKASDHRVRQSMDIARKMGLKAVVFHTNYIVNFRLQSYLDTWLDRNEEYWTRILEDYPEQEIYMENMFDESPAMLLELSKRMEDKERFGICLDIAHGLISGAPLEQWLVALKPQRISHLHINDNDGVTDLHQPVGTGKMPWQLFTDWCRDLERDPSILIEVRGYRDLAESVKNMEEQGIYPFV